MVRLLVLLFTLGYLGFAAWWVLRAGVVHDPTGLEILNVACDPTRELWQELNTQFIAKYERETGRKVRIRQSHGGSSSQARSVIEGLDADLLSLALWTDTDAVRKAGRLQPGWEQRWPNRSLPYTSTIVMVVRKGNPKQIHDWSDLLRDDVTIITPNPKTSGNGKWSFLALWGAVIKRGGSEELAREYVTQVLRRVPVFNTSARGATMVFAQQKIGDVHLTWENEAQLEVEEAQGELEIVYPPISVLAEPHLAIVDEVVDRKGTRPILEAYMAFLYTEDAQRTIAKHHHRPTHERLLRETVDRFPQIELFTARDLEPDWERLHERFFAEGGEFDQAVIRGRQR